MNKDKILKPYEQNGDGNYVRYSISHIHYAVIYKHSYSYDVWYCSELWDNVKPLSNAVPFSSKEEAMDALDIKLIEEGYTLLTQEQYEKLLLLL